MKRIYFNIVNIMLILFFSISMCFSQEDKLFKKEMKEVIGKLGGDIKGRRESLEKIWAMIEIKKDKRMIPILIEELGNKDEIVVLEVEALLYRITEYNCYGICVGNRKGVEDWNKWWRTNERTFKIHSISDNYYRYYYTNPKTFVYNMEIYFWKNIKSAGLPIPKYSQGEKLTKELEILVKRLIDRYRDTESCKIRLVDLMLEYIGKPVVPYVIDRIYEEGEDEFGPKGIGREGIEFLDRVIGIDECNKTEDRLISERGGSKAIQQWWRDWWEKNKKSYKYIINRYESGKGEITKKRVDKKLTPELEKEIKLLIEKLGSDNKKERELSAADLIDGYRKTAVPYLIESFEGASTIKSEKILYTLFLY